MPKFTVTVEVRQFIELEVEANHEDNLFCDTLHFKLPPETQEKLSNPQQYGKVITTDIEVEEVIVNGIDLGVDDYEFEYDFTTFNNNQILELHTDGENLTILFSDGAKKLLIDDDDIYNFIKSFNFDTLTPEVKELWSSYSFRLPSF